MTEINLIHLCAKRVDGLLFSTLDVHLLYINIKITGQQKHRESTEH